MQVNVKSGRLLRQEAWITQLGLSFKPPALGIYLCFRPSLKRIISGTYQALAAPSHNEHQLGSRPKVLDQNLPLGIQTRAFAALKKPGHVDEDEQGGLPRHPGARWYSLQPGTCRQVRTRAPSQHSWSLSKVSLDPIGLCAHIYYAPSWKAPSPVVLLFACSAVGLRGPTLQLV